MILPVVNAIYAIAQKSWEKTYDFNGISIRDLAIPVGRSTHLSYKATDLERWSVCCIMFPWKRWNVTNVYEINHIWELRKWNQMKNDLAVVNAIYAIEE